MASTSNIDMEPPSASTIDRSIQQRNPWPPETGHANDKADDSRRHVAAGPSPSSPAAKPSDPKSPAGVALRAFFLGAAFGISLPLIILLLVVYQSPFWRLSFFLLILSLFHVLEFYITARFNPAAATTSAFLLSQNGSAYNVAHTLAFLECALHCYLWPHGGLFAPRAVPSLWLLLGLGLVVVGQTTRTMAMVHAGSNFNHLVQSRKKQGHVLVTGGIYAWLRHPSYFGFFWWGLGTQLALGNIVCLAGYAVVLWRFFRRRIQGKSPWCGSALILRN